MIKIVITISFKHKLNDTPTHTHIQTPKKNIVNHYTPTQKEEKLPEFPVIVN